MTARDLTPEDRRRDAAETLMSACRRAGSRFVFGVPGGGSNLDVVGAAEREGLRFVLTHTETAAAIMAGVVGELSGAPGICVATRGPGAASTVNGVAQAMLDRQPMLIVTDCVAAADRARISHQRLDQPSLFAAVAKASVVLDGRDPTAGGAVVRAALEGRPGPVHVDIDPTEDPDVVVLGRSRLDTAGAVRADRGPARDRAAGDALDRALAAVAAARRPVAIVGVGAVVQPSTDRAAVAAALAALGSAGVPVLTTYSARGAVSDDDPWAAGVATAATIEGPLLDEADLVVGVGLDPVELIPAPWDHRAPVVLLSGWPVDDSSFFDHAVVVEVVGPLANLVETVTARVSATWSPDTGRTHRARALAEIAAAVPKEPDALTPQQVVDLAAAAAPEGTVATVDAGAHMLYAVPAWPTRRPGELLISSGLATMGFALPAAIAAALVEPARRVVCFTGDGGLGMVLGELETLARLGLPVTVVVFDDAALSLIAAKQRADGHGGAGAVTYRPVDFAAVAAACGLAAERVADIGSYERALASAFDADGPNLIDVVVDPSAYSSVLDAVRGPRR